MLNKDGKQIQVNKIGQLVTKFVKNFTGFVNYKQRKNYSTKDKSLMYDYPKLNLNKENTLICPTGSKLARYAQFPYQQQPCFP